MIILNPGYSDFASMEGEEKWNAFSEENMRKRWGCDYKEPISFWQIIKRIFRK